MPTWNALSGALFDCISQCPQGRPDHALYLKPLPKPISDVWFQRELLLDITHYIANTIPRLFREAGISGHYTNHSLRATTATRLFDAGIDEQLIIARTGHSSTVGVRSYKRITEPLKEMTSNVLKKKPKQENHHKQPEKATVFANSTVLLLQEQPTSL